MSADTRQPPVVRHGTALARLQQAITIGALGLGVTGAVLALRAGEPVWAAAVAAAVLGGHAAVLALEFVLMAAVHGDDPTPRATAGQLLRAWWGEVLMAPRVFCGRQPFRHERWPDRLPPDSAGRRGVVLVHGFVCNRGLWNPWMARLTAMGTPFVAVSLEPVFGGIDETIGLVEEAVRRVEAATGLPPVLVGHSMGGLVISRWWAEHGDETRVHRVITIGTPHHGTWLARFATTRNARQMQRHSRWLQTLAAREPAGRASQFTCFYGHADHIVFPASTATLPGAHNCHLAAVAHVDMAFRPEPWDELQRWLQPAAAVQGAVAAAA